MFNGRHPQRRPLENFKIQKPSLWTMAIKLKNLPKAVVHNDGQCHLTSDVAKCTTLVIFLKPELNSIFFIQKTLFTSKARYSYHFHPKKDLKVTVCNDTNSNCKRPRYCDSNIKNLSKSYCLFYPSTQHHYTIKTTPNSLRAKTKGKILRNIISMQSKNSNQGINVKI